VAEVVQVRWNNPERLQRTLTCLFVKIQVHHLRDDGIKQTVMILALTVQLRIPDPLGYWMVSNAVWCVQKHRPVDSEIHDWCAHDHRVQYLDQPLSTIAVGRLEGWTWAP
jgi:hypothetical protein